MASLSTHVLDTAAGQPAAGVVIELRDSSGTVLGTGVTNADGRVGEIGPAELAPGAYSLRFDVDAYQPAGFFPEIVITFRVAEGVGHYHVPVLLSPFGYTTYRGS